jgi:hypothetical protein
MRLSLVPHIPHEAQSMADRKLELHARSWIVGATTSGGAIPSWAAWMVVQRGVGISSTRPVKEAHNMPVAQQPSRP